MKAFFKLFAHIKSQGIPMTAPVKELRGAQGELESMAFLYPSVSVGHLGMDGEDVDVEDFPSAKMAVVGLRGGYHPDAMVKAHRDLQRWANQTVSSAPFLFFGYDGPAVPPKEKYSQIAIPL